MTIERRHLLQRFGVEQRGSVAISFALLIFSICGAVGVAVDLSRANAVRTSMQSALDQAVIAVATGKQGGHSDAQTRLATYMAANWKERHGASTPTLTYTEPDSSTVAATATSIVPTTISNVVGFASVEVTVKSQASHGVGKAEVALVLDTTRSMEGSKLDAVKSAAESLIVETYAKPEAPSKIRFSLVPFGQYVNVGTSMRGQSWLSVPNDSSVSGCWMEKSVVSKSGCSMLTGTRYDDGIPVSYQYEQCTSITYGPDVQQCGTWETKWHGCVGSRTAPRDAEVEVTSAQPVPGIMDIWCANELLRLTNSQSTLKSAIGALGPSGQTYMAPGLIWGWRTLSQKRPFEDGSPMIGPNRARKVMVLMTDGANTTSASYPAHEGWDAGAGNAKTAEVCNAAKNESVEIYAIAFEVTDQTALDLLQACASSPITHYFNASDTTKLMDAFRKIGESLTMVRLSK